MCLRGPSFGRSFRWHAFAGRKSCGTKITRSLAGSELSKQTQQYNYRWHGRGEGVDQTRLWGEGFGLFLGRRGLLLFFCRCFRGRQKICLGFALFRNGAGPPLQRLVRLTRTLRAIKNVWWKRSEPAGRPDLLVVAGPKRATKNRRPRRWGKEHCGRVRPWALCPRLKAG